MTDTKQALAFALACHIKTLRASGRNDGLVEDMERARAALSAQPVAGVVALTWYEGAPPFPQDQEWFIAETTFGDRVVLRSLDEGRQHKGNYAFKTADETYMKLETVKRWMQFPDCDYIPPQAAPAPEPTKSQVKRKATAMGWTPPKSEPSDEAECERATIRHMLGATKTEASAQAVADHIENRIRTWRQRTMNESGDRLALDDFMGNESILDFIDFVCDEWEMPLAASPKPQQAVPLTWHLDADAAETLKQTIGDDDTVSEITLSVCDGHEGHGLYVWLTEYPEEGSLLLRGIAPKATQEDK